MKTDVMNEILLLLDEDKIELTIASKNLLEPEKFCRSIPDKFYFESTKDIEDDKVIARYIIEQGYRRLRDVSDMDFYLLRLLSTYKSFDYDYPLIHPNNVYVRDGEFRFLFPCQESTFYYKTGRLTQIKIMLYCLYSREKFERIAKRKREFLKIQDNAFFNKIEKARNLDTVIKIMEREQILKQVEEKKSKFSLFKRR